MPTYEYRCESCGRTVEVVQGFTDDPLTTCESCGGSLRKVYAPVGIVFKGSGFYKTDSRSGSKSATRSSSESGGASATSEGTDAKAGATKGDDAKGSDKGGADAKAKGSKEPVSTATAPAASESSKRAD